MVASPFLECLLRLSLSSIQGTLADYLDPPPVKRKEKNLFCKLGTLKNNR